MLTLTNECNMQLMARYPDKHFDLAIVDPPYGIGANIGTNRETKHKFSHRKNDNWDNKPPSIEYFNELFRVSKNQIIWGANHFSSLLPSTRHFCVWDKKQRSLAFSDCEMAYIYGVSGFGISNGRVFDLSTSNINYNGVKYHPTQKPVLLYKWLLNKYSKQGDLILDTNLGSGSIAIACNDLGFDLTGCELDKDYYDASIHRLKMHNDINYRTAQLVKTTGQNDLFIPK